MQGGHFDEDRTYRRTYYADILLSWQMVGEGGYTRRCPILAFSFVADGEDVAFFIDGSFIILCTSALTSLIECIRSVFNGDEKDVILNCHL
jgi:hypothetical protein